MKKVICLFLAAVLTLSLCACGLPETKISKLENTFDVPEQSTAASELPISEPPAAEPESAELPEAAPEADDVSAGAADEEADALTGTQQEAAPEQTPAVEPAAENETGENIPSEEVLIPEEPSAAAAKEPDAQASAPVEPKNTAEGSADHSGNSGGSSGGVTVPEPESGENLVWIPTNGGTKYHSKSGCSNMKNPIQVTLETAVANGFTPCKRCH